MQTLEETDLFFPNEVEALAITRAADSRTVTASLGERPDADRCEARHAGLLRNARRATVASACLSRKTRGHDRRRRFFQRRISARLAAEIEFARLLCDLGPPVELSQRSSQAEQAGSRTSDELEAFLSKTRLFRRTALHVFWFPCFESESAERRRPPGRREVRYTAFSGAACAVQRHHG